MEWHPDLILANLPAVLFHGYADGTIDPFDRKIEALTGFPKADFDQRRVKWTDLILPEDLAAAREAIVRALRSTDTYTREYRIHARAGEVVWIHERSRIVRTQAGRIEVIVGLFFDISERRALQQALRHTEQQLKTLIGNLPAALFTGYLDGTAEMLDDKVEAMTGYPRDTFGRKGLKWTDLICETDREGARTAFITGLRTGGVYVREYRVRGADGHTVWIHERSRILFDESGRADSVSGLFFDVTDRKGLEVMVAERTAELQRANGRLLAWAAELERRNAEASLLGKMGDLLQSCSTSAEAYAGIARFLAQLFPEDSGGLFTLDGPGRLVEARVVWGASPPTDTEFPLEDCWALRRGRAHGRTEIEGGFLCRHVSDEEAYLCIPMAAHGSALGLLHVALASGDSGSWDERQALAGRVAEHLALALAKLGLQETLQHLSVRDALTGLFNRRYLDETLARDLHRAKRQGTRVGVMMIDIDHFKRVNDTLGHDAGDMLLKELGALLQRQIRSGDLACRYGGEEFTIVLQDVSQEVALRRAEQICESARQMSVRHGDNVLGGVTVSIGVALSPVDGTTREAVVKAADVALYRAKHEGRDRVCAADTGSDPPTTAEPE